jgi:hypothetical protein
MMGSISSPMRNSTTRGRAAEFEARLVCPLAGALGMNSNARIAVSKRMTPANLCAWVDMRRESKNLSGEIRKQE